MQNYQKIKDKINKLASEKLYLIESLEKETNELTKKKKIYEDAISARAIIQSVAEKTQKNLEEHISSLVTLAINTVFPESCLFGIEFVQKRNKTECIFYIEKNGIRIYDLLGSDGGGLGDVVSLGLRVAFWKLDQGRPIFILDEPFRFLNGAEEQQNVSEMLNMLSKDLGVQIIAVTDQENIQGDKKWRVQKGKVLEINS